MFVFLFPQRARHGLRHSLPGPPGRTKKRERGHTRPFVRLRPAWVKCPPRTRGREKSRHVRMFPLLSTVLRTKGQRLVALWPLQARG